MKSNLLSKMAQLAACWAHNPKVDGSKPSLAKPSLDQTLNDIIYLISLMKTSRHCNLIHFKLQ